MKCEDCKIDKPFLYVLIDRELCLNCYNKYVLFIKIIRKLIDDLLITDESFIAFIEIIEFYIKRNVNGM